MNATAFTLRPTFARHILRPGRIDSATVTTTHLRTLPSLIPSTTVRHQHHQTKTTMEWLVIVPDHANALSKRLEARPKHLDQLPPEINAGNALFGGAMLSAQPKEGETPPMTGSVMLFKNMTEDEVRQRLKTDPYTKGGVWNVDAAKIMPFKTAFRTAM